jgi:hypothetical protein
MPAKRFGKSRPLFRARQLHPPAAVNPRKRPISGIGDGGFLTGASNAAPLADDAGVLRGAARGPLCAPALSLLLHFESAAVERRDHSLHQPVFGDVSVRAFIGLCEKRCGRHPLDRERISNHSTTLGFEIDSLQSAVLRVLTEPLEHITDRGPPFDNRAVGKIDLCVFWILGDDPVPVAFVERVKMFVQDRLRAELLLHFWKLHLGLSRDDTRYRSKGYKDRQNCFHDFLRFLAPFAALSGPIVPMVHFEESIRSQCL